MRVYSTIRKHRVQRGKDVIAFEDGKYDIEPENEKRYMKMLKGVNPKVATITDGLGEVINKPEKPKEKISKKGGKKNASKDNQGQRKGVNGI